MRKSERSRFNINQEVEIICPDCGGLNIDISKLEIDKCVCHSCNKIFKIPKGL